MEPFSEDYNSANKAFSRGGSEGPAQWGIGGSGYHHYREGPLWPPGEVQLLSLGALGLHGGQRMEALTGEGITSVQSVHTGPFLFLRANRPLLPPPPSPPPLPYAS